MILPIRLESNLIYHTIQLNPTAPTAFAAFFARGDNAFASVCNWFVAARCDSSANASAHPSASLLLSAPHFMHAQHLIRQ